MTNSATSPSDGNAKAKAPIGSVMDYVQTTGILVILGFVGWFYSTEIKPDLDAVADQGKQIAAIESTLHSVNSQLSELTQLSKEVAQANTALDFLKQLPGETRSLTSDIQKRHEVLLGELTGVKNALQKTEQESGRSKMEFDNWVLRLQNQFKDSEKQSAAILLLSENLANQINSLGEDRKKLQSTIDRLTEVEKSISLVSSYFASNGLTTLNVKLEPFILDKYGDTLSVPDILELSIPLDSIDKTLSGKVGSVSAYSIIFPRAGLMKGQELVASEVHITTDVHKSIRIRIPLGAKFDRTKIEGAELQVLLHSKR